MKNMKMLMAILMPLLFGSIHTAIAQGDAFVVKPSGAKQYISVATPVGSNLRLNDDWTLETLVFVPATATNSEIHLIETYSANVNNGGFVLRLNNKKVKAYTIGPTGWNSNVIGATQVTLGAWNHVAATFNESTGSLKVYLNGVLDGQTTLSANQVNLNSTMYIGARGDDQAINQPVHLEETRIWNYERSAAQIKAAVNTCLTGSESGLVAYYNYEGVTNNTLVDKSNNGNTGTIINYSSACLTASPLSCTVIQCASNGRVFNPDGILRALVVYVIFEDGPNAPNPNFSNANQFLADWDMTNGGLPNYVNASTGDFDAFMYNDVSDFTAYTPTDPEYKNVSNFYNLMSKPEKDFMLLGEVFSGTNGLPTVVEINPTTANNWGDCNLLAFTEMANINPTFSFAGLDERINNPNYNAAPVVQMGDDVIDFVIFMYRYSADINPWAWQNQPKAGMNTWSGSSGGFYDPSNTSHHYGNNVANPSYKVSSGFTICAGGGLGFEGFVHEMGHANYNFPHIGSVNGVVGDYFYGQEAYGSTLSQRFLEMNAYERWKMQYIDVDDVTEASGGGTYLLQDYLMDGDALRIEIPFSNGQHLWIENHKKENPIFDEHVWAGASISNAGLPTMAKGGYMYVENIQGSTPNQCGLIDFWNKKSANGIKMIFPGGQHDYTVQDPDPLFPTTNWGNALYQFTRGVANPIGGTSPWTRPRYDVNNNGAIFVNNNANSGGNNEGIGILGMREDVNAGTGNPPNFQNVFRGFGVSDPSLYTGGANAAYDGPSSFVGGDIVNMGSNPTITNYPTYSTATQSLNTVYLNGLEIEYEDAGNDDLRVYVRYKQVDVSNDVRWTGNDIVLPNITGDANDDLFLTNGSKISLFKTGIANRETYYPGTTEFINPTTFTVASGAKMHLDANTTLWIAENSTFILEAGAELILEDGARIIVDKNATFYLKGNNITLNGPNAEIAVYGALKSDPSVDFTFTGTGYVSFYPTHTLDLGTNSRFVLIGAGQGQRFMEIKANTTVHVDGHSLVLNQGRAIYEENTKLIASGSSVFVNYVDFKGTPTSVALEAYNNISYLFFFRYNYLEQFATGIDLSNAVSGTNAYTNIVENTINNCNTGIRNNGMNSLVTTGNEFNKNQYAIYMENGAGSYVSNGDHLREGLVGISTFGSNFVTLNDSWIHNFETGIYAENTTLYLRNQSIIESCDYGIQSANTAAATPADKIVVGDVSCAYIINNSIAAISGNDITLEVDAITHAANRGPTSTLTPNRFDGNPIVFDVCYDASNSITQIDARKNHYYDPAFPAPNPIAPHSLTKGSSCGTALTLNASQEDATIGNCQPIILRPMQDPSITETDDDKESLTLGFGLEQPIVQQVKLYPNPTTGNITIDLGTIYSNANLKVTNVIGQIILTQNYANSQQVNLELEAMSGVYFIHLKLDNEEEVVLKVVKQ